MWEILVSIATAATGALVWSFKQQSRINELFVMAREREKYDTLRQISDDRRHAENRDALKRIEDKMDDYYKMSVVWRKTQDHERQ